MKIFARRKWLLWVLVPLVVLVGAAAWLLYPRLGTYVRYRPQEGDVVFQSLPPVALVRAIEGVTASRYSHCGVVARKDGRWIVIESIGHVRKTGLLVWIARGRGGLVAAYRLKAPYRADIPAFLAALEPFLDRPYDFSFTMDDEHLYCSELVYKAYKNATGQELGALQRLGDMNWKPFEDFIRQQEPGPPPLDRLMITPAELARAEQLEKVFGGSF